MELRDMDFQGTATDGANDFRDLKLKKTKRERGSNVQGQGLSII